MSERLTGSILREVEITFRFVMEPFLRPSHVGKPYEQALEDRIDGLAQELCRAAAMLGAVGEYKNVVHREFMWRDLNAAITPDEDAPRSEPVS
jgi:hypothetical protein